MPSPAVASFDEMLEDLRQEAQVVEDFSMNAVFDFEIAPMVAVESIQLQPVLKAISEELFEMSQFRGYVTSVYPSHRVRGPDRIIVPIDIPTDFRE